VNRLRRWSPGREYTPAIGGHSWYAETEDTLTVAVVLSGYWGGNQPELDAFGPWDEVADQLWVARIPKDGPGNWRWSLAELSDKPRRAVRDAVGCGEILSRTAIADIPGVRLVDYYGLIRYEDQRDVHAVNLWRRNRLRGEVRQAAARRRWRRYRDAETWHPGSYKGIGRKYYAGKRGPR
jgi:hypothetical protein